MTSPYSQDEKILSKKALSRSRPGVSSLQSNYSFRQCWEPVQITFRGIVPSILRLVLTDRGAKKFYSRSSLRITLVYLAYRHKCFSCCFVKLWPRVKLAALSSSNAQLSELIAIICSCTYYFSNRMNVVFTCLGSSRVHTYLVISETAYTNLPTPVICREVASYQVPLSINRCR